MMAIRGTKWVLKRGPTLAQLVRCRSTDHRNVATGCRSIDHRTVAASFSSQGTALRSHTKLPSQDHHQQQQQQQEQNEKEDHKGWHTRWEEGNFPWHLTSVNPTLDKHVDLMLGGGSERSVLVTMCGKSVDLLWLCSRGHSVTGVELSSTGVEQLFQENSIPHTVEERGEFSVYTATDRKLTMYCGDMLKFLPSIAGQFDAIWDRGALVAINVEDRQQYTSLLVSLLKPNGRILMVTFIYEEGIHMRFPFRIDLEMIRGLFEPLNIDTQEVEKIDMAGSSVCERHELPWAIELVTLLTKKQ